MTGELSPDLRQGNQVVTQGEDFTFSPVSTHMQVVGQLMLNNGNLLEVQEGVFSTCPDQKGNLGDRLISARDAGIPLVEVLTVAPAHTPDELKDFFAKYGLVVFGVRRSDGEEHPSDPMDRHIHFETVGLAIPAPSDRPLAEWHGLEVTSCLKNGRFIDYEKGNPAFSVRETYEYGSNSSSCPPMYFALYRALEDFFEITARREGMIEGSAFEISEAPQLPHGEER